MEQLRQLQQQAHETFLRYMRKEVTIEVATAATDALNRHIASLLNEAGYDIKFFKTLPSRAYSKAQHRVGAYPSASDIVSAAASALDDMLPSRFYALLTRLKGQLGPGQVGMVSIESRTGWYPVGNKGDSILASRGYWITSDMVVISEEELADLQSRHEEKQLADITLLGNEGTYTMAIIG